MGAKKNRRAKVNPVTRGQRNRLKKRLNQLKHAAGSLDFGSQMIKDKWNRKQTARKNFERLGLKYDVNANAIVKPPTAGAEGAASAASVPTTEARRTSTRRKRKGELSSELDALQNAPAPPPRLVQSMALSEQRELMRLKTKYGDDLSAMELDTKNNPKQKTAGQLRKRFDILERLQNL